METLGLLDNRNLVLWNTLTSVQSIEIQKEKRVDYLVFSKNEKSIIYVPFDNLNVSSFTHELLHIYLRTKQVFIGAGLIIKVYGLSIVPGSATGQGLVVVPLTSVAV